MHDSKWDFVDQSYSLVLIYCITLLLRTIEKQHREEIENLIAERDQEMTDYVNKSETTIGEL